MRLLGVAYALGAVVFVFYPTQLVYLLNVGPKAFNFTEAIPDPAEHFWIVIAAASMAMLSALSFFSAESPKVRGYFLVHLLAKVVTFAGYLYMFLNEKPYFAYLLGIMTDLLIVAIVLRAMIGSRRKVL
ncbi:MAG: hypothetical protein NDJ89_04365 [Oligoflexia bacterium]|nr:hypothetical protein [Oligoflexia bacterium]